MPANRFTSMLAFGAAMAVAVALSPVAAARGQATASNMEKLDITAFAISMGTVATGANATVDITIRRWSTAEERQSLINAMTEKGPDELLKVLQKLPSHGKFRIPGLIGPDPTNLRLGNDLHYAWQTPLPEGGRRIVIATDRYITFEEARAQPRTIDYPFTLFEIHVNKAGEGEGKMSVATKIEFNKKDNQIVLENWSSEPVRLNKVKVTTAK
jgi:hypothetical protein